MRIKILLTVICVLSILTVSLVGFFTTNTRPTENVTTSFSAMMNLLNAPAGTVYFMYPGNNPSDHVAYDTVMNMCANRPQIEYYYATNDLYVDINGRPRANVIDQGKYMVFIGGPFSQDCVKYYENTAQALCKLEYNGTHLWWETSNRTFLEDSFMAVGELDGHHDMFMLEYFVDDDGRGVFICYGYGWRGTWIGVEYLSKIILSDISRYTKDFYIFKWVDKNNDSFPDVNEVSEDNPKYASVQATLQSTVNMTTLKWFADACHTLGLKVTWYVGIYSMNDNVNALLKQYIRLGDSVQLSFGYGASGTDAFFNKMEPEARLNYVDRCMDAFKRVFGYYPTMVQAYYLDAYTLTYISLRYASVKGAVAYCNHEVFTDDFRFAGAYYMPYYPSKYNTLTPNSGSEDKIDIAVMPYIQRDVTNSILKENVGYNLDPQDGSTLVNDWRQYFTELFNAYVDGWDQFGLAFYTIDLTYKYIPFQTIEEDLNFIRDQIQTCDVLNVVDSEFILWFRQYFHDSPCYKWEYTDPLGSTARFEWDFSPQYRMGYVNGSLIERRQYQAKVYEGGYNAKIVLYDNSQSLAP